MQQNSSKSKENNKKLKRITSIITENIKNSKMMLMNPNLRTELKFYGDKAHNKYLNYYFRSFNLAWKTIEPRLNQISASLNLKDKTQHNFLAKLLGTTDNEFIDEMDLHLASMPNELFFLALIRLKDIYNANNNANNNYATLITKNRIKRILHNLEEYTFKEFNPFAINSEALLNELLILIEHASKNPGKKVIWLGSAKYVMSMAKEYPEEGTYLHCSGDNWSWQLNKAYILAAVNLGYEFQLIEQHRPEMEKIILSGKASLLIELLAKYIQSKNKNTSTIYDGGYCPTATCFEIMLLMDLGLKACKKENGTIIFKNNKKAYVLEDLNLHENSSVNLLKHSNSEPNLEKVSENPPKPEGISSNDWIFSGNNKKFEKQIKFLEQQVRQKENRCEFLKNQ